MALSGRYLAGFSLNRACCVVIDTTDFNRDEMRSKIMKLAPFSANEPLSTQSRASLFNFLQREATIRFHFFKIRTDRRFEQTIPDGSCGWQLIRQLQRRAAIIGPNIDDQQILSKADGVQFPSLFHGDGSVAERTDAIREIERYSVSMNDPQSSEDASRAHSLVHGYLQFLKSYKQPKQPITGLIVPSDLWCDLELLLSQGFAPNHSAFGILTPPLTTISAEYPILGYNYLMLGSFYGKEMLRQSYIYGDLINICKTSSYGVLEGGHFYLHTTSPAVQELQQLEQAIENLFIAWISDQNSSTALASQLSTRDSMIITKGSTIQGSQSTSNGNILGQQPVAGQKRRHDFISKRRDTLQSLIQVKSSIEKVKTRVQKPWSSQNQKMVLYKDQKFDTPSQHTQHAKENDPDGDRSQESNFNHALGAPQKEFGSRDQGKRPLEESVFAQPASTTNELTNLEAIPTLSNDPAAFQRQQKHPHGRLGTPDKKNRTRGEGDSTSSKKVSSSDRPATEQLTNLPARSRLSPEPDIAQGQRKHPHGRLGPPDEENRARGEGGSTSSTKETSSDRSATKKADDLPAS